MQEIACFPRLTARAHSSGDDVLDWWAEIATWTGLCEGDTCVDSAIPYTNFNDWFHFSASVAITEPGTPEYEPPLSDDLAENADDWSYQKGLEGGWIPQDPTDRLYPDICD